MCFGVTAMIPYGTSSSGSAPAGDYGSRFGGQGRAPTLSWLAYFAIGHGLRRPLAVAVVCNNGQFILDFVVCLKRHFRLFQIAV